MLAHPIDAILDNSATDFDLYLEVGGRLSLYAHAPYQWSKDELSRLLGEGHRFFYYSTTDRPRVEAYQRLYLVPRPDLSLPPAQRILSLTDTAAEVTKILYNNPLTPATMARFREIASAMVACIDEDRSCVAALGKLAQHDYYTYYHSARVSAYALAIAMELSLHDEEILTELATGALMHDIGKTQVDLAVLNKQGALTKEEWDLMRDHPVFGDRIVQDSQLALLPRQIILHHHERLDGSGYPHQLTEHELLDEVKIVAFVDVFDALTTNRPYQVSRSHFEALDFIRHKLLKNMHKDSFQALVSILGAAPPPPDDKPT